MLELKRLDFVLDVPGVTGLRVSTEIPGGVVVSLMWPREGCPETPIWSFYVSSEKAKVAEFSSFPFMQRVYRECHLAASGAAKVELIKAGAGA